MNHITGKQFARITAFLTPLLLVSACQSQGGSTTAAQDSATTPLQTAAETTDDANSVALASASTSVQACHFRLAGGPPPKPARGKDFGTAVGKNIGKGVQRGIIRNIGGRIGGGLGAAVASGVANSTIRNEEDVKGVWKIVDGATGCGCEISIDSLYKLTGKGTDSGQSRTLGCQNPTLQRVANWSLGYSFTGYDSKFQLKAKDTRTTLATLNRDGIHYFSGSLADGTPVTMWRDKQTSNQLASFKRKVKAASR